MKKPAVFLDRDDTLLIDPGFVDHPDKVTLTEGAISALRVLKRCGYTLVLVTNQSGVARGLFDEAQLAKIHHRLQSLLRSGGVELDAIYYCPYLDGPEATVEAFAKRSDLRKPAPGMLFRAAGEMDLDLERSWMIGDSARDIEAGEAAGCRTIHINRNGVRTAEASPQSSGQEQAATQTAEGKVEPTHRADSLLEAAMLVEQDTELDIVLRDDSEKRDGDGATELLGEIRDLLDKQRRAEVHDDFSLLRLFATLVQMLAIAVAVWGVVAMFADQSGAALVRFALALFLQMVMVSLTVADKRR